jgi:tetratricopeptide (TPR) repeat protein
MGYPDRAIKYGYEGIKLAQSHDFSLITARLATAFIHKQRGDIEETEKQADLIIQHANEKGLPGPVLWASIFKGWILGQTGESDKGISLISDSLAKLGYQDPAYMSMLVELYILANMPEEGLQLVDELLEIAESKNEYNYEPELLRLRYELLLLKARANTTTDRIQKKDVEAIEKGFINSLNMANKQGAISLQLRSATSLALFLKDLGRSEEGKNVLSKVYDRFSEGLDTSDLKKARLTLDELF